MSHKKKKSSTGSAKHHEDKHAKNDHHRATVRDRQDRQDYSLGKGTNKGPGKNSKKANNGN